MNKSVRIKILLAIDTAFFLLELITGYAVHSLALVADSFHMFNDILSLVVALWAVRVAKSGSSATYTYGLQRAEILGALVNGVFLLALCVTIALEAIQRFIEVPEVSNPKLILIVGSLGLLSNIVGLFLFHEHGHSHGGGGHSHGHGDEEQGHYHDHEDSSSAELLLPEVAVQREETRLLQHSRSYGATHDPECHDIEASRDLAEFNSASASTLQKQRRQAAEADAEAHGNSLKPKKKTKSMNMEGVWLHVLGDALGNVGVILTALFIWKTEYSWRFYADPFISLVITCIIFSTALPLCKRAGRVLLQATPASVNADEVRKSIAALPGIVDIHDMHIWQLNESSAVATLHVAVDLSPDRFPELAKAIQRCFASQDIPSITIQPEFVQFNSQNTLRQCVSYGNLSTGGLNSVPQDQDSRGISPDNAGNGHGHGHSHGHDHSH